MDQHPSNVRMEALLGAADQFGISVQHFYVRHSLDCIEGANCEIDTDKVEEATDALSDQSILLLCEGQSNDSDYSDDDLSDPLGTIDELEPLDSNGDLPALQ